MDNHSIEQETPVMVLEPLYDESSSELVTVITLPEIKTTIEQILPAIKLACDDARALECTEDSRKEIKAVRARLNKANAALTAQFKAAISAVKAPITAVEQKYKECTEVFKAADKELAEKINTVEDELKRQKAQKLREYFAECAGGYGIDFLKFEDAGLNITLSASEKSLKGKIFDFVNGVYNDLNMIEGLEYRDEVLAEYRTTLNASCAVRTVNERHRRIDEERKRREEEAENIRRRKEAEQAVFNAVQECADKAAGTVNKSDEDNKTSGTVNKCDADYETAPLVTDIKPPGQEKTYTLKFSVTGTMEQLKAFKPQLIELIERNGLSYE